MGGAVALPLVVEVAFGGQPLDTGTLTWTDISDYVRRTSSIDFSRGWDTETDEPIAGRLTFTVNNESGDFTPGQTGAFGEVRNRLPVRVSAVIGTATGNALTYDESVGWYDMLGATYDDAEIGTVVLWTGLVESWRQSWENGVRSQVQVTCVDRWAAIRRVKINSDRIAALAAVTGASLVYPCTDAALPMRELQDRTPYLEGGSKPIGVSTPAPSPRSVPHPTDPSQSVSSWNNYSAGTTVYVSTGRWSDTWDLTAGVTSTVVLKPSLITTAYMGFLFDFGINLNLSQDQITAGLVYSSGLKAFGSVTSGGTSVAASGGSVTNLSDWHTVTVTLQLVSGTVTVVTYLDGEQVATNTGALSNWSTSTMHEITFGGSAAGTDIFSLGLGGLLLHRRALSSAEAQALSRQTTSWAGDTAAERAIDLARFAPVTLITTGTFTSTMSMQDLGDKSLGDALMECATAEDGTLYMGTDGWPVLTSRSWRTGNTVAFTIPAHALSTDLTFTLDDQQLINSATVDRMVVDETAGTVRSSNDDSVETYGEQNKSLQIWVDTDAQHLERANAEANQWSTPLVRSSDLTVDILTKNATIAASTVLGADIGQRIAVSGMPAEAPGATQFFIESISDRVTHTGWERTFTVSPRLDYFTIEDATFGATDSTNVLAF